MLVQSETEPMTFAIRLVFGGSICRKSLRTSVIQVAKWHPLLTSCVRTENETSSIYHAPPNELIWASSDLEPEIIELPLDDSGLPSGLDSKSDRIDLREAIGFKTFVFELNGQSEVHFLFHHAVCDGLGGFKFVKQVLAKYHSIHSQTELPIPISDPETLKLRNSKCETSLPWHRRMIRSSFVLPHRILGMIGQTPAMIAANAPDPNTITNQPVSAALEMPTVTLSKDETADISRHAKEHQSTTNELLIHRLFQVLYQWNQNSSVDERKKLRVIIPFSLRNSAHRSMPAANCVSMVYVDAGNSASGIDSLAKVSQQLDYIRKWQIEYSWNQTASFAFRSKRIESLLRTQSGSHLCTTVLSNLGQPFKRSALPVQKDGRMQVGDLTLQSAHIAAPTTTNTIATFAALFYAGRLTLTLNYNKVEMSREDAQALIRNWSKSLRSFSKSP